MPIDSQLLRIFSGVAQLGSFSRAAKHLDIDKSAVSRAVNKLEQQLGIRLLYRSTHALRLTDAGEMVWLVAKQINDSLDTLEHYAQDYAKEAMGVLRVSCSSGFGRVVLLPAIDRFLNDNPRVQLQLAFEDRFTDLIAENIDVALRHSSVLPDSALVARPLADSPRVLVAAPAYLAKVEPPSSPMDLSSHACLAYGKATQLLDRWRFEADSEITEVRVVPRVILNDTEALKNLAIQAQGLVLLDRFLLQPDIDRGALVEVLPQYRPTPGFPIHAVYPARKWLPRKVTAFIEFVEQLLESCR
ncbi:LysR family transcriptional regulator [Dyella flagellata]|nr:LysR family transcriptional regulator [Dyella flagellata]